MCKLTRSILLINPCQFLVLIILLFLAYQSTLAQRNDTLYIALTNDSLQYDKLADIISTEKKLYLEPAKRESKRIVAALLCVALGPFGVHRLYLGTKPQVPAAYSVTLGGGLGFIPLVDFFVIVFSKDLGKYRNNAKVIMWAE